MPLVYFSRDLTDDALLGIWHATESTENLIEKAGLTTFEMNTLRFIKLEKRQREWLAARVLLRIMGRGANLSALPNGKPMLDSSAHISISHSMDLAGIVLAGSSIGMDIQSEDVKLLRIERKFTNDLERSFLPDNELRLTYLTLIWSAKEAIFKYFGEHVDFAGDIHVRPFHPDDKILLADYTGQHGTCVFELQHLRHKAMHIVITSKLDL